jgi:hypothetical protein
MNTTASVFDVGGKFVTCTEMDASALGMVKQGVNCMLGNEAQTSLFEQEQFYMVSDELIDQINLTLVGEKTYNGRGCWEFNTKMSGEILGKLIEEQQKASGGNADAATIAMYKNMAMENTVCLDKELGVSVKQNASFLMPMAEGEPEKVFDFSVDLVEVDASGANNAAFTPPVDFAIENPLCEGKNVSFDLIALNNVQGSVEVSLGEYNYEGETAFSVERTAGIGSLGVGDRKTIELVLEEEVLGAQQLQVCSASGKCGTTICYNYDISGLG